MVVFEKIQAYIAGSQNNTRVIPTRNEKLGIMIQLELMPRGKSKVLDIVENR